MNDDDYLHNLQMLMLKLQCSVTTVCNTQIYHYTNKSRIKCIFTSHTSPSRVKHSVNFFYSTGVFYLDAVLEWNNSWCRSQLQSNLSRPEQSYTQWDEKQNDIIKTPVYDDKRHSIYQQFGSLSTV